MAHHQPPSSGGDAWSRYNGQHHPTPAGGPYTGHNPRSSPSPPLYGNQGQVPYETHHRPNAGAPPPNSRPPQPPPPPPQVDDEIPPCPMSFPQIQGMSVQELRKILGDRAAFDMYIEEHPHRQQIVAALTKVRNQVEEMRARNDSRQADLERMTGGGSGKSMEEQLAEEKGRLDESQRKFDEWLSRNSREQLGRKLKESADEALRASEDLTERFQSGDMTFDEYTKQYFEARRSYHERKIKLARFNNLRKA